MKKLFNKIELKPLLISIGLVLFQSFFFVISRFFHNDYNLIGGAIDNKIIFTTIAIIPYCFWYFLIFYVPYYLYKKDKKALDKYIAGYVLCAVIASIIFIIYPTTVARPIVKPNSILNTMTYIVFWVDNPPINCLPSLHCAVSMLFSLACFSSNKISTKFKIMITISSILVMISTLYIKQHVFIDLVTGDIIATICFLVMANNQKVLNKIEKLLKL